MEEEKLEKKENSTEILERIKENTEKKINQILDEEIRRENIDYLSQLVDIHKDVANEEYWCIKEENMKYRNYGNYPNDAYGEDYGTYGRRRRDSRGRYMEDGSYGRRGVKGTGRGRYRGEEKLDEMMEHYGNYSEGKEMYGNDGDTMKSFKYMLKAFKDYYKHLKQEASSQEEVELLEQTAQDMMEM